MISTYALREFMLFFPVFLLSLCIHEWAHAMVANRLGDPTAKMLGRLSLNPLAHADPMGTIFFPLMAGLFNIPLLGWAKPVPVDERNFKKPRVDTALVAAAGPFSNILFSLFCAAAGGFLSSWIERAAVASGGHYNAYLVALARMLQQGIAINLFLAFFNLIPLGPLDGAKILQLFVPLRHTRKVEELQQHGGTILMFLVLLAWVSPALNFLKILAVPVSWAAALLTRAFYF